MAWKYHVQRYGGMATVPIWKFSDPSTDEAMRCNEHRTKQGLFHVECVNHHTLKLASLSPPLGFRVWPIPGVNLEMCLRKRLSLVPCFLVRVMPRRTNWSGPGILLMARLTAFPTPPVMPPQKVCLDPPGTRAPSPTF